MSDAWQPDDSPFPRAATTGHHGRLRTSQAILHDARPVDYRQERPQPLSEDHDGKCIDGLVWAFLIEGPFLFALGWAIAALLRAAIH